MSKSSRATGTVADEVINRGARIDDAILRVRERRARARGAEPTVIPYIGYGSTDWVRVLGRVVLAKDPVGAEKPAPGEKYERVRGWRSFTSVPVESCEVAIEIEGHRHQVLADRGGVIDAVLAIDLAPGWHDIGIRAENSDSSAARVFIVDPAARFGIVSDIDDTVMVTALPRPLLAAWNTFVLDVHARSPTPGMAVLYERLTQAHPSAPVIYLSTGAWNVAPTLTRFLSRNLYPAGALLLTDWGPTRERWFRSGREHKRASLARLAEEFPDIRWLLIGDDGQHDEEIYAEFAAAHPGKVAAVAIRQLLPGEAVLAGGRSKGGHGPRGAAPWIYASDGAGLAELLTRLELLESEPRQPTV